MLVEQVRFHSDGGYIITGTPSSQSKQHLRYPGRSPEKKVRHRRAAVREARKFRSLFLSRATAVPDFCGTPEDLHSEGDPTFSVIVIFLCL